MKRITRQKRFRDLAGFALSLFIALSAFTWTPARAATPPVLSKEYIRLGSRLLAIEVQGSTATPTFESYACLSCGFSTSGWLLVGAADFDGNGVPDLVYQNASTSQVNVDYYGGAGGSAFIGWACLTCSGGALPAGWQVVAVADFDGNGVPDLVIQQTAAPNQVNVNYYGGSGGATYLSSACLSCGISTTGWVVRAAADFDGNGTPDLIYQNTSSSQVNVDYYGGIGGSTFIGYACLTCGVGGIAGWQVTAAADFDGNGTPDLVYQNTSSSQVNVDYYGGSGGATFLGYACLSCSVGGISGWRVGAAVDFDGNGTPDLVYQNIGTAVVNVDYY
jgi:hypothetical protein